MSFLEKVGSFFYRPKSTQALAAAEKTVEISLTADDLENSRMYDTRGCAGYRAIKRVIPDLDGWGFEYGYVVADGVSTKIFVPEWVGMRLSLHAMFKKDMANGKQAKPFTFKMTIPSHIRTNS